MLPFPHTVADSTLTETNGASPKARPRCWWAVSFTGALPAPTLKGLCLSIPLVAGSVALASCTKPLPPAPPATAIPSSTAPLLPPKPRGLTFARTSVSDEWVRQTLVLGSEYKRILIVDSSGAAPKTIAVSSLDLNARPEPFSGKPSPRGAAKEQKVDRSFATLQEAANEAEGGDLVAVMPGVYSGFCLEEKKTAGDGQYIHFKALGAPGQVIIDKPCPDDRARWMIYLRAAHHVVIEGFNLKGQETPGDKTAKGPWAGIMLDGAFGQTGKLSHHVALVGNFSHHHAAWGLHSTDTHSVLIQDSVFGFSAREHSAYVSDGSDN